MTNTALPEPPQHRDGTVADSDAEYSAENSSSEASPAKRPMPTSQPILLKAMKWGITATILLIVIFGTIGWFVSASTGLVGGVMGAAFAGVFLALTIGSITFANRFITTDVYIVAFFGIVMGSWILKVIAFLIAAVLLRDQPWLNPTILFIAVVAGVIVSLVIDVIIVAKSRIPVVPTP